jgi:hypothetical protein
MHGWAPLGGSGAKGCKKNGPQSCQIDISRAFGAFLAHGGLGGDTVTHHFFQIAKPPGAPQRQPGVGFHWGARAQAAAKRAGPKAAKLMLWWPAAVQTVVFVPLRSTLACNSPCANHCLAMNSRELGPVTPCTCRCVPPGASMNAMYTYHRRHVMHAAGCSA